MSRAPGFTGVVVEPNESLLALHRRVRPRDVAIRSACGEPARLERSAIRTIEVRRPGSPLRFRHARADAVRGRRG